MIDRLIKRRKGSKITFLTISKRLNLNTYTISRRILFILFLGVGPFVAAFAPYQVELAHCVELGLAEQTSDFGSIS